MAYFAILGKKACMCTDVWERVTCSTWYCTHKRIAIVMELETIVYLLERCLLMHKAASSPYFNTQLYETFMQDDTYAETIGRGKDGIFWQLVFVASKSLQSFVKLFETLAVRVAPLCLTARLPADLLSIRDLMTSPFDWKSKIKVQYPDSL